MKKKTLLILSLIIILSSSFNTGYSQIINAYARVTNIAGATLTIANVDETNHTFNAGEDVIVMQMQGNVIGANTNNDANFGNLSAIQNVGRYEVRTILSRTATTITLTDALAFTYDVGANARVQVISNRKFGSPDFVTTSNISGLVWNGNVGGIIAFQVPGTLTMAHSINANGIGFRGGALEAFTSGGCDNSFYISNANGFAGFKGEGIYANTNTNWNNARGKILNGGGGGNASNGGGGGGGNYTGGGDGGPGFDGTTTGCSPTVGGLGGLALSAQISGSRVFLGGGGGGGEGNEELYNNVGGRGGGIILISAGSIITSCGGSLSITSNGTNGGDAAFDGAGGGGGGGSIVFEVGTWSVSGSCPVTISSNAGNGGNTGSTGAHGGGAGGGQGTIVFSGPIPPNTTNTTTNGIGGCNLQNCSTRAGGGTGVNNSGILSGAPTPLPILFKSIAATLHTSVATVTWQVAADDNVQQYEVQRSLDGSTYSPIGTVASLASKSPNAYNFNDANTPAANTWYYRVLAMERDGKDYYSPVVPLNRVDAESAGIVVVPNPIQQGKNVALQLKGLPAGQYQLLLIAVDGRVVASQTIDHKGANAGYNMSLQKVLPQGMYMARLVGTAITYSQKVVVE